MHIYGDFILPPASERATVQEQPVVMENNEARRSIPSKFYFVILVGNFFFFTQPGNLKFSLWKTLE